MYTRLGHGRPHTATAVLSLSGMCVSICKPCWFAKSEVEALLSCLFLSEGEEGAIQLPILPVGSLTLLDLLLPMTILLAC